jgi:hypothetical protein
MDFSVFNVGGIDHSPAPWICRFTIVLDEPELATATNYQFERFWRVWYMERGTFAPSLADVTIVLRPGFANGTMVLAGINRFLDYFNTRVEPVCDTKGLHIYLDSYTSIVDHTRFQVLETPQLFLSIPPDPRVWPPSPPIARTSFRATMTA